MRLKTHLIESADIEYIVDNIKKKCGPFFKSAGPNGDFLFRGSRRSSVSDKRTVIKIIPRTDRRPLDTDLSLHEYLDELFKKYHGWNARSEGVFVTANRNAAKTYGKPFIVFPIGSFKFLYNPDIKDLTTELDLIRIHVREDADPEARRDNPFFPRTEPIEAEVAEATEKSEKLLKLIKGYKNKDLSNAMNKEVEVMIKCKEYLMVDSYNSPLLAELEKLF